MGQKLYERKGFLRVIINFVLDQLYSWDRARDKLPQGGKWNYPLSLATLIFRIQTLILYLDAKGHGQFKSLKRSFIFA